MLRRIRRRYEQTSELVRSLPLRPALALRAAFAEGYGAGDLRADVLAGVVVGIVALPLSMALGIASGMSPQQGLTTAIVAGFTTALLGGSRFQVSGPTAAFVVILQPVVQAHGPGGLLLATLMAGALLAFLGLARMGRLVQFIPYPVTTGFTTGIGVVIALLQVRDFLGLRVESWPEHTPERVAALVRALPTTQAAELGVGLVTLFTLLAWPRLLPRVARVVPGPLVGLAVGTACAAALTTLHAPGVATLGSRFHYMVDGVQFDGIPRSLPSLAWPWSWAGGDGEPIGLSLGTLRALAPAALAIAMLGAIESLLSAVIADGLTGKKHDADAELVGQGVANLVSPFFGGFASTGALARTATNIRAGARSPVSAMVHSLVVLLAVLLLAPALGSLPMASLAALLLVVAYNMSDLDHFRHMMHVAPRSDLAVMLVCFGATVLFDMVIAVTGGVLLAALLFMRRMAEISGATLHEGEHAATRTELPPGVYLYQIAGPLFFGAAQKAVESLDQIAGGARAVIFDMTAVPAMDATGLVALESAIQGLRQANTRVVLAGVQAQPKRVLERAGWAERVHYVEVLDTLEEALALVRSLGVRAPR